jgi:dienelactone hydrolase
MLYQNHYSLSPRYYLATVMTQIIPFKYHNSFRASWPIVRDFFKSVREGEGSEIPIYVAGFCWGGKHVVNLGFGADTASNGKPLINAGFTGHPSFLEIPSEIEKINIPISFALGDNDLVLKLPQVKQIQAVFEDEAKSDKGEVQIYEGAGHGFCVRADLFLEDSNKHADESENQALAWFERHQTI